MKNRVALLWHGDREARNASNFEVGRLGQVAQAFGEAGLAPEPAVYNDDFADEGLAQLRNVDAVLVWVNPINEGRDRSKLDALLEQVANEGVLVSAHPRTIQAMGTKEVLFRTRAMSWGSDVNLFANVQDLRETLPSILSTGRAQVIKRHRGHSGQGVWKLTPTGSGRIFVRHAQRGSIEEETTLEEFLALAPERFAGGPIIVQAYQERIKDGMVRCYLVQDKVAGFGHQEVNALFPGSGSEPPPEPGPRLYYPPTKPEFQAIRRRMEEEWLPAMLNVLDLTTDQLPLLWDADLMYGSKDADGDDSFVLCEINVSSVYPFPDDALRPLAQATVRILNDRRASLMS